MNKYRTASQDKFGQGCVLGQKPKFYVHKILQKVRVLWPQNKEEEHRPGRNNSWHSRYNSALLWMVTGQSSDETHSRSDMQQHEELLEHMENVNIL